MMNTEDLQKAEFLTKEQISKMAPSVFAPQPSQKRFLLSTHTFQRSV